jgi:phospholipase/carboxylesterase
MNIPARITRRRLIAAAVATLVIPSVYGCLGPDESTARLGNPFLNARPGTPSDQPQTGLSPLGLGASKDGLLYVPESYDPATPATLIVAFHEAGGSAGDFEPFYAEAEARGFVLLVPESRGQTWDLVRGPFGPDVEFLDLALEHAFDRVRIATTGVAFMGIGDGAAYALSLGVSNGELVGHLIGFAPGFYEPAEVRVGKPPIFIAHGVGDDVVAVAVTRDVIVPRLKGEGYQVEYEEFEGGHEMPAEIVTLALNWLLG